MADYSGYICRSLLEYLDSWYEHDTDRTNYAQYLLTMQGSSSVKEMISIYNKVLWKFILKYHALGNEDLVSTTWYDLSSLSVDTRTYWQSLNCFLNENIERFFNSQEYSNKLSLECFVNLRDAINRTAIQQRILSKSSEDVTIIKDDLLSAMEFVDDAPNHLSPYNIGANGYLECKPKYIENVKFLIKHGFIRSIKDISFEASTKITYFPNTQSLIACVLITGIVVLILAFFMAKISLMTLIIIIGLPGALISILRKG